MKHAILADILDGLDLFTATLIDATPATRERIEKTSTIPNSRRIP